MKKLFGLCCASTLTLILGCSSGSIITDAKPDPPTGVTAVATTGQVVISWAPTVAAAGYKIYFSNSSGVVPGTPPGITGITATTYTQTPVTHGLTYYYIVTAYNPDGEGRPSAQVSATP